MSETRFETGPQYKKSFLCEKKHQFLNSANELFTIKW